MSNIDNLILCPGVYEDTFVHDIREKVNISRASLIHIDNDLSSSRNHILNICKNIMTKNTYIVFHDDDYAENRNVWERFVKRNNILTKFLNIDKKIRQRIFQIIKI